MAITRSRFDDDIDPIGRSVGDYFGVLDFFFLLRIVVVDGDNSWPLGPCARGVMLLHGFV